MNKWPNNLPKPVDPLDNFLLAQEQSKRTQNGKVPDIRELMAELERTVSAARGGVA